MEEEQEQQAEQGDDQCDQIGQFLQVLGNKLSHKSSPNILVIFWTISNNVTIM